MTERKMSRKAIETAVANVVNTHEEFFVGTQGITVMNGNIITKIDTVISEMGMSEKAETKFFGTEWYIVRKYH